MGTSRNAGESDFNGTDSEANKDWLVAIGLDYRGPKMHDSDRNTTPDVISIREAAYILGIAEQTVRNWLSLGTAPFATAKVGRRRIIKRCDVIEFLEKQFTSPRRRGRPPLTPAPDAIGTRS